MTGGRGDAAAHAVLDRAHRQSWPGMLASVIATARDFDLAEDALQHAFVVAASRWPEDGIPERPEGWLVTAARRRAIDVQRRETTLARKAPLLLVDREQA
ncbi:MAG TPA: sigma factor, partial [Thermomicrobiales bacterium]|nr:sigma factor [Thermomicrobiales bacterium]